jgi:hypothetical protein
VLFVTQLNFMIRKIFAHLIARRPTGTKHVNPAVPA